MMSTVDVIATLGLAPLPREGGFFRVQWVSAATRADGRAEASMIWFLLTREAWGFSALHRVDAEETWEFHAGDMIEHVQLGGVGAAGHATVTQLGATRRRVTVSAHAWQGARLSSEVETSAAGCRSHGWALVSCLMRPAWSESGFELGAREALSREFPAASEWVRVLTRAP